ncbi:MAG: phenylalanine--tRNA ligase subunit beta [Ignavibacteria bacterium]|nr:phenylalanine--tRNA ligase subunit beta [Ignavibacteria bacterium]
MKVSHKWLCDFVELPSDRWTVERVSRVLTDLGLEVEDVVDASAVLANIVVGKVLEKQPHPKADKLSVCTVDVGAETKTIVCGAANVAAGQTVPVALVGAVVPSAGFAIEERPLRGVTSQGMICSQAELNLGEDASGIWVLDDALAAGAPLAEALKIDDVIYDIAITPNRADCLSHVGIARELAAYAAVYDDAPVVVPQPRTLDAASQSNDASVEVRVENADVCSHYIAHVVTNVRAVESPAWLKDRLIALGLRPSNVIVDITNYINMEMGQPLHAFDMAKLRGNAIVVRTPHADESAITLLDGKERKLDAEMLLICDGERPIAVAGVMGGQNSEIDETTTTVVIESAYFHPTSIRRTAKKLGLSTDASYRFERGVDPAGVRSAADLAVAMLCDLAGGSSGISTEIGSPITPADPIAVEYNRVRSLLGIAIDDARIDLMLRSLGFGVVDGGGNAKRSVEPPSWRADVRIEADIAEEVMRLYGIDRIPTIVRGASLGGGSQLPESLRAGGPHGYQQRSRIRTSLAARGYVDCVTNVLGSPEEILDGSAPVMLRNALGHEFSAMRSSLIPSLLRVASHNIRHGAATARLMEFGNVFEHDTSKEFGIKQSEVLAMVLCGQTEQHWSGKSRALDIFDLVGDVQLVSSGIVTVPDDSPQAPFTQNTLRLFTDNVCIGVAGQLDPGFCNAYGIDIDAMAAVLDARSIPVKKHRYRQYATFPAIERDVALVVPQSVTAGQILNIVQQCGSDTVETARIFDVFSGGSLVQGYKSIGIRIVFRSSERTLTDADVDPIITTILDRSISQLQAHVRGLTIEQPSQGEIVQ